MYMYVCVCIYIYIYTCTRSGRCRCALTVVPRRLRLLSIFGTFDNMLKLSISPQAKRAESDPRLDTPTVAHFQPTELYMCIHAVPHITVRGEERDGIVP